MAEKEWYRSTDWSVETQRQFETKLTRARPYNRAQYLRIQAIAFLEIGDSALRAIARDLLHRMIREYPDHSQLPSAHENLANAYQLDKLYAEAEEHYRACLESYVTSRSGTTGLCDLSLCEQILEAGWQEKYGEVERLLDALWKQRPGWLTFHNDVYRFCVARARLDSRLGRADQAAILAGEALRRAEIRESQFPRHPGVGLARADEETLREMRCIATGKPTLRQRWPFRRKR